MNKKRINLSRRGKKIASGLMIILFALVGVWILNHSFAAAPTATATCGARVTPYSYPVPFGNAVWNQPVCGLPRYARSADYASRFYHWANRNDGSMKAQQGENGGPGTDGGLGLGIGLGVPINENFTRNVYYARDATTTMQIASTSWESNLDGVKWSGSPDPDRLKMLPDTRIPWNPSWRTGEGGDNEIVILDESNGKIYEIYGYKPIGWNCFLTPDRLCVYTAHVGRDAYGNIFDYRTFEGQTGGRGVGLHAFSTFVTAAEVQAGEIRHAMGVAIVNSASGPDCTDAQLGTAQEGVTCGTAVAPASKFEWGGDNRLPPHVREMPYSAVYNQSKLIPEGMRFALDINDAGIESWINSRADLKADARKAQTARIFARALRDYGMIVADTSGNGAGLQVEGAVNPVAKQQWASVGMDDPGDANMLQGLITSTNLYVVEPPTVKCLDHGGISWKYFCNWISASYASTPASSDTVAPLVTITAPTPDATLKGTVVLSGTATDNVGVARVEFDVDNGKLKKTVTAAPYSFTIDTTQLSKGTHTLVMRAYDAAGLKGEKSMTFIVDNTVAPTIPKVRGDFTNDGIVELIDLSILITNFEKPTLVPAYTLGDCNGDGKIELIDLSILITNFTRD